MRQWKQDLLIGGLGYPALEILYRGRTHWTMGLTGAAALLLLRRVHTRHQDRPLLIQALRGGAYITALEYAVGRRFNRKHHIWDYRHMPWNLHGQICLPFSLAWCGLSAVVLGVMQKAAASKQRL